MKPAKKVLIVDDDPNMTRLLNHHFAKTDFQANSINDPTAAMAMIRQQDVRIVLLDIDMPVKNGLELLAEIKAYDPTIAVVMFTGHETLSNLVSAFQGGAEYILLKPVSEFPKLLDLIQRCYDRLQHWYDVIEAVRKEGGRAKRSPT
jgi:DNA-binding NtrC family response regulator